MLVALGWLHAQLFRLVIWLLKLPFRALASILKAMAAMVGEEFQRWLAVVVAGLMVFALGWVALRLAPGQELVLGPVALLGMMWFYAVVRAVHYTMSNNLVRVRQRQMFRQLSGDVNQIGDRLQAYRSEVVQGVATRARGTPAEGMFRSNRDARTKKQEQARKAAERAASKRAEREEAARVAAEQAAAEQATRDAAERTRVAVLRRPVRRRRHVHRPPTA